MKKSVLGKKLSLNRETIVALEVSQVAGEGVSLNGTCYGSCDYTCISCKYGCYVTDGCNGISYVCTLP